MAASASPCRASSALLAVTTDLPAPSAAAIAALAGSAAPPISSTKTSMPGSVASATGSRAHLIRFRFMARFLARERAVTATTSIGRPQRADNAACSRSMRCMTAAPTVPSPARPTLSGAIMKSATCRGGAGDSAARGEGDDVVQLFRAGFKEPAQIAGGLADTLLVLDQGDAHEAFPVLAEADAGRHSDFGLLDQERREVDAAERPERLGQRRPGEHRGARRRDLPAGAAKTLDQDVAAALVGLAHL